MTIKMCLVIAAATTMTVVAIREKNPLSGASKSRFAPVGIAAYADDTLIDETDKRLLGIFGYNGMDVTSEDTGDSPVFEKKGKVGSVPVFLKRSPNEAIADLTRYDGIYMRLWNDNKCGEVVIVMTTSSSSKKYTVDVLLSAKH